MLQTICMQCYKILTLLLHENQCILGNHTCYESLTLIYINNSGIKTLISLNNKNNNYHRQIVSLYNATHKVTSLPAIAHFMTVTLKSYNWLMKTNERTEMDVMLAQLN